MSASPLHFVPTLSPEDAARANFYALLGRLFYAPPDRELLAGLAGADEIVAEEGAGSEAGAALPLAWRDLTLAAATADPEAVADEHTVLFVGTGKSEVTPYTSAYTIKSAVDNPLVELRDYLAARGLARLGSVSEPEDHVAGLCEVMRHLIAVQQAPAEDQKAFFESYVWPGAVPLCDAVTQAQHADFYKRVARFAKSFFQLEQEAFEM